MRPMVLKLVPEWGLRLLLGPKLRPQSSVATRHRRIRTSLPATASRPAPSMMAMPVMMTQAEVHLWAGLSAWSAPSTGLPSYWAQDWSETGI